MSNLAKSFHFLITVFAKATFVILGYLNSKIGITINGILYLIERINMMKVAIIGAGLSGLSCAIALKRNGITPVIFEKSGQIGDSPTYLVAVLRLFHNSLRSPMSFLEKNYGIELTALNPLKEIIMISPRKQITARGNLGHIFTKGPEPTSIESQLASIAGIPISFNTTIDINQIKNDYDYIIVASGSYEIPKALGVWNLTFQSRIRIATLTGNFKPGLMKIWLNKYYSKNGYAYQLTKNETEAELTLIVSDSTPAELDNNWNKFLACEDIKYTMTKIHDIEHHVGFAKPVQLGNIYFIGNVGGMADNFLGFGSMRSIQSGFIAAHSIIDKKDYYSLLEPIQKDINGLHEYRKMINNLTNEDYDKLLTFIGFPIMKQLLYNNALYKAKYGIFFPKLVTSMKNKKNNPL